MTKHHQTTPQPIGVIKSFPKTPNDTPNQRFFLFSEAWISQQPSKGYGSKYIT